MIYAIIIGFATALSSAAAFGLTELSNIKSEKPGKVFLATALIAAVFTGIVVVIFSATKGGAI